MINMTGQVWIATKIHQDASLLQGPCKADGRAPQWRQGHRHVASILHVAISVSIGWLVPGYYKVLERLPCNQVLHGQPFRVPYQKFH